MIKIHARWLVGLYDHLRNCEDTIRKGFEMAGIKQAIYEDLPAEDPFIDMAFFIVKKRKQKCCSY